MAYGFDKKKDQQIAVYDLGGGTFDISILDVSANTVEVKSTNGDTHLGGDDFDKKIIDWIISEFKKQNGLDLSKDPMALQRIKDAGEKAKIELSSSVESEINQPFIAQGADGSPLHLVMKMTRAKLEELVDELELFEFRNGADLIQDAIGLTLEEFREADELADAEMEKSKVLIRARRESQIYQSAVDHIVSAENISDRVRVAALMYLGTASSRSPDVYPQIESVREIYDEIAGDFDNVHNFSGSLQRALQHIPEDTPMQEAAKVIFYTVKNGRKLARPTDDPLMRLLSMMGE